MDIKMKIKQTIKKIEEEIEEHKKLAKHPKSFWDKWGTHEESVFYLKAKLSGYKLALEDVLSEMKEKVQITIDLGNEEYANGYHSGWTECLEELKKPIQEVLK